MDRSFSTRLFRSYWIGGFEAATHLNSAGERIDMIAGTRHDIMARSDFELLQKQGFRSVREAIPWYSIDRGDGAYDFGPVAPLALAACELNMEVHWTLCHYGYPPDIDIFSDRFVRRFAEYSENVVDFFSGKSIPLPFITPINEISFFAWAGCRELMAPFAVGRDAELKRQLVRATTESCRRLLKLQPRARFIFPEPLINVVAPADRPDLKEAADRYNEAQFEAWDMIAGRKAPELGGEERFLDILGVNFYHANQWEVYGDRLRWEDVPRDPRWKPFREMLATVWERYRRPLFISETSHFGVGRGRWIEEIGVETLGAIDMGVPVHGICLYPILDRYDWNNPAHWHKSGLWEISYQEGTYNRVLNPEYAQSLQRVKAMFEARGLH